MRETSTFKIRRDAVLQGSLVEIVELPKLEDLIKIETPPELPDEEAEETEEGVDPKQKEMEKLLREVNEKLELAKENLQQSEQSAKEIVTKAEREAQSLSDDIRQKAYQEGIQRAQGEIQAQIGQQNETFDKFIYELKRVADEQNERIQSGILDVAVQIARKVIDIQMDRDDELFIGLIKKTATILRQDKKRILRISVEDYTRYFGVGNERHVHDLQAMGIDVVRDVLLEKGDCVLDTGYGTVNTGVSKQLRRIEENLREEL